MSYDFSYLSEAFSKWHDQKFKHYGEHLIEPESDEYIDYVLDKQFEFIQSLGLTTKQFEQAFLAPYLKLANKKHLSFEVLKTIADIQSKAIGHRKEVLFSDDTPLIFKVEPSSMDYLNALDWTVINVMELSLPGFEPIDGEYDIPLEIPFQQCRYCGQKDNDKGGIPFDKKRRYCHIKGCKKSAFPNPEEHKRCCVGQWGLLKKTFRQRLYRHADYPPEVKRLFEEFCNDRLEKNLKITTRVQRQEDYCYE